MNDPLNRELTEVYVRLSQIFHKLQHERDDARAVARKYFSNVCWSSSAYDLDTNEDLLRHGWLAGDNTPDADSLPMLPRSRTTEGGG